MERITTIFCIHLINFFQYFTLPDDRILKKLKHVAIYSKLYFLFMTCSPQYREQTFYIRTEEIWLNLASFSMAGEVPVDGLSC